MRYPHSHQHSNLSIKLLLQTFPFWHGSFRFNSLLLIDEVNLLPKKTTFFFPWILRALFCFLSARSYVNAVKNHQFSFRSVIDNFFWRFCYFSRETSLTAETAKWIKQISYQIRLRHEQSGTIKTYMFAQPVDTESISTCLCLFSVSHFACRWASIVINFSFLSSFSSSNGRIFSQRAAAVWCR